MDVFSGVLSDTMQQFMDWAERAGPKLLAAVVILIVGWLVAKVVKVGITKGLKVLKLDVVSEKAGIERFLKRGNIQAGSVEILGTLVYWLLLLMTLLVAMKALGIAEAQDVFRSVVAIVPRVILAVVILIIGLSFAGFISDVVQTAAVNAHVRQARLLANVSRYAITVFVAIVALSQLDIGTDIISRAFLILFGSVCLAASLAFGLGCRDLAARIAEGIWQREQDERRALQAAADGAERSVPAKPSDG